MVERATIGGLLDAARARLERLDPTAAQAALEDGALLVAALLAGHPAASVQRAASTGIFSSTGWISRPASEPLSTTMLMPVV